MFLNPSSISSTSTDLIIKKIKMYIKIKTENTCNFSRSMVEQIKRFNLFKCVLCKLFCSLWEKVEYSPMNYQHVLIPVDRENIELI